MEIITRTNLQLPELSRKPEDARGHVMDEQLSKIMNICVSAAKVAASQRK